MLDNRPLHCGLLKQQ
jgi:hypothetical protein